MTKAPPKKIKWRSEKIGSAIGRATSQTSRAWFFSVFLSARDHQLKREKERKKKEVDLIVCCVYQLPLAGLVISLPLPCWYLANLFFLFSIFCFSYLPFYCAAAIAKLVCFFFTPRQCRPLNTNVGERKWKVDGFPTPRPHTFLLFFLSSKEFLLMRVSLSFDVVLLLSNESPSALFNQRVQQQSLLRCLCVMLPYTQTERASIKRVVRKTQTHA